MVLGAWRQDHGTTGGNTRPRPTVALPPSIFGRPTSERSSSLQWREGRPGRRSQVRALGVEAFEGLGRA